MSIIQSRLKHTQRSFEEIRQQLISIIQNTDGLNQRWTDYNDSDLGMVLLELWCSIGDELHFMLDNQVNEAYLITARQRKSVVSLCKLIAYNLDPAVSSEGIVTFKWVPSAAAPITPAQVQVPKYTRLTTSGAETVPFVTIDSAILPAGINAVNVRIRQGVLFEEEFESEGIPHFSCTLSRTDIAANFGAIEVLIGQGEDISTYVEWTEAKNFIINSPEDNQKRFVVETDHRDQITIKFGDGKFGAIPPLGFTIVVRYLSSMGASGNVGSNTVTTISDPIRDVTGISASLSVSNTEACVGGTDRETIEHAKRQAPQELAALYRMVTRFDGDALLSGLAGISKAKVWGEHELPHPDIKHFNQMYVTFVAEGVEPEIDEPESWMPTQALRDLVLEFSEDKKIVTTKINFVEPNVIFIDVQLDVYVAKTASPLTVKQLVLDKLNEFFDIENQDFGKDVRYSNLLKELDAIPNVEYVKLKLKRHGTAPPPNSTCDPDGLGSDPLPDSSQWSFDEQDIICRRHEFAQLGTIEAVDATQNYMHFGKDEEPIRAKFGFYPPYQIVQQPLTLDATSSSSPNGEIVTYQWNMGARGKLLLKQANGALTEAPVQPADSQSFSTNFDATGNLYSSFVWKYTERPAAGMAVILLTVFDAFDNCAAYASPFEVRL